MFPRLGPPLSTWAWPVRSKGMFTTTRGCPALTYMGVARAPQGHVGLGPHRKADYPREKQIILSKSRVSYLLQIIIRESRLSEHDNGDGLDMFVFFSLPRDYEFE